MAIRSICLTYPAADLKRQDVSHQTLVAVIADQSPFLGRSRSPERALLGIELQSVRLFREIKPAGISSSSNSGIRCREYLRSVLGDYIDIA